MYHDYSFLSIDVLIGRAVFLTFVIFPIFASIKLSFSLYIVEISLHYW